MEIEDNGKSKLKVFIAKNIAWIIVVTLLVILSFGGNKYYENTIAQEEIAAESETVKQEIENLKKVLIIAKEADQKLKQDDENYSSDYLREKKLRKKAEKERDAIKHRVYPYTKLDSLAKHIEYQ